MELIEFIFSTPAKFFGMLVFMIVWLAGCLGIVSIIVDKDEPKTPE